MMKATIPDLSQRAGGWCKPVKGRILPLLELPVKSRKAGTLYRTFEWPDHLSGNLGGNADSFRPMFYYMAGKDFFMRSFQLCLCCLQQHVGKIESYQV